MEQVVANTFFASASYAVAGDEHGAALLRNQTEEGGPQSGGFQRTGIS